MGKILRVARVYQHLKKGGAVMFYASHPPGRKKEVMTRKEEEGAIGCTAG